ncbi:MAG TPA: hypothetical protein VEM95_00365, partial [Thermoplasmata archaeon]|nr:hypothetical protein [Thermoplasmata archaeon]
ERPSVFGAFVASLVLFGLAIWTLVWGVAPLRRSELNALFPILPWVWAPVVLAHAVLFASASAHLPDPRARSWAHAGIFILAALAAIALLDEIRIVDLGLGVLTFAGWTFVGYLLLASSFQGTPQTPASAPAYPPVRGVAA